MSLMTNPYHQGCLESSAFAAAAAYFVFTDEDTPSCTRIFMAFACAISMYALRYFFNKIPSPIANIQPSDTPEYRAAFNRAFERLKNEGHIAEEEDEKCRERLFRKILDGVCFGQTLAQLRGMYEQPNKSALQVAKAIKLEEVIYLQLRTLFIPSAYGACRRGFHWFPSNTRDLSFALPWKEKVCVLYAPALESEKSWIEATKEQIQAIGTKGRLSFSVNAKSSHTFAFWHSNDHFGFFNGDFLHEYTNCEVFCKALRDEVLRYRQYW